MMLLLLGLAAAAELVPSLAADPFRPVLDGEGGLGVDTGALPQRYEGRVTWVFAMRPLVAYAPDGDWTSIIESSATAHASAAGRVGWLGLGLDVPLVGVWGIEEGLPTWAAGDPLVALSLSPWSEGQVRLALDLNVTIPLGGDEVWAGHPGPTGELLLVLDARPGVWFTAINVGLRDQPPAVLGTRPDSPTLDRSAVARALVGRGLGGGVSLAVEALASGGGAAQSTPLEVLGSFTQHNARGQALRAGVGVGVLPGVGAPLFRLVLGVGQRVQPDEG